MNAITKAEAGSLALQEAELLSVLRSSLYPGASDSSIRMVLGYCKAAGLDPMQKPVHIVPMWDGKAGQMRDVVMPGVTLYRTQASRSGSLAGVSEPEFGPMCTESIGGQQISYPEWCKVTVRRQLSSGIVADFTAVEYWLENYAIKGGKEKSQAPNAMWTKRPRGQLAKCAEAQALRKAFPELGAAPTAEEMEGKQLHPEDVPSPAAQKFDLEDLTRRADEAAAQGCDAYAAFVKDVGVEAIAAMGKQVHDARKLTAKAADEARTIEGETA